MLVLLELVLYNVAHDAVIFQSKLTHATSFSDSPPVHFGDLELTETKKRLPLSLLHVQRKTCFVTSGE